MPTIPDEKLYWQEEEEKRKQRVLRQQQGTEIRPMVDQLGMGNYNERRNIVTDTSNTQRAGIEASAAKQRQDRANLYQQEQGQKAKWAQQESQRAYRAELKKLQDQADAQRKEYMEYARQYGPAAANQNYGGGNNFWNGGNSGAPQGQYANPQSSQIAQWARQAGWAESDIPMVIAIAMAESGGKVNARNQNSDSHSTIDAGLMQINTYWHRDKLNGVNIDDPIQNLKIAKQIYDEGGWSPWSTYDNGAYKNFLRQPTAYATPTTTAPRQVSTANGLRNTVVSNAMQVIGLPYVWGGNSLTSGVDCSGLVQQIYGQLGVSLPRTAHEQSHSTIGTRAAINQLQPGDLVAWQGGWRGPAYVGHIAIYAGNGQIIEAPDVGMTVRRRNLRSDENVFGYHLSLPGD